MKIEKTASGSQKITMSKEEWIQIGKQAQWDLASRPDIHEPIKEEEKRCPECGEKLTVEFEPSYQEYPGATPQPSYTNYECPVCGWSDSVKGGSIEGQENKRGW